MTVVSHTKAAELPQSPLAHYSKNLTGPSTSGSGKFLAYLPGQYWEARLSYPRANMWNSSPLSQVNTAGMSSPLLLL